MSSVSSQYLGMVDPPDRSEDLTERRIQDVIGSAVGEDRYEFNVLYRECYDELRLMADRYLGKERADITLGKTEMTHIVWIVMRTQRQLATTTRTEFLKAAAQTMKRKLIDHARGRNAIKRGGKLGKKGPFDEGNEPPAPMAYHGVSERMLVIDRAIEELRVDNPLAAQIAELHLFAGIPHPLKAEILGVSPRNVDKHWSRAKTFLQHALGRDDSIFRVAEEDS